MTLDTIFKAVYENEDFVKDVYDKYDETDKAGSNQVAKTKELMVELGKLADTVNGMFVQGAKLPKMKFA